MSDIQIANRNELLYRTNKFGEFMLNFLQQPLPIEAFLSITNNIWRECFVSPCRRAIPRWLLQDRTLISLSAVSGKYTLSISKGAECETKQDLTAASVADFLLNKRAIRGFTEAAPLTTLHLPFNSYVVKPLRLPLASRLNVEAAAELQLESATPFLSWQVYWGVSVSGATSNYLLVDLMVASKVLVDSHLTELIEVGIKVDNVGVADLPSSTAFLQLRLSREKQRFGKLRAGLVALSITLIAQIAGAAYLPIYFHDVDADKLHARADDLSLTASKVGVKFDNHLQKYADTRAISQFQKHYQSSIDLLSVLSHSLPTGTTLTRLLIQQDRIDIAGSTISTSTLVDALAKIDRFQQATYLSPVAVDSRIGKERFNLSLKFADLSVGR